MKKIFLILFAAMIACSAIYAEENSEKTMGASIGARLSLLGAMPEASFIVKNLEVGVTVPILSGTNYETDEKVLGVGVGGFFGYLSNPFAKGFQNAVGLQYLWLTNNYMKATLFSDSMKDELNGSNGAHIFSLYYRGCYKFTERFGISFRGALPLFAGFSGRDSINIIDTKTSWACWLMALGSFSLGVRFEI